MDINIETTYKSVTGNKEHIEILFITKEQRKKKEIGRIVINKCMDGYTMHYYPICLASYQALQKRDKGRVKLLDTTVNIVEN